MDLPTSRLARNPTTTTGKLKITKDSRENKKSPRPRTDLGRSCHNGDVVDSGYTYVAMAGCPLRTELCDGHVAMQPANPTLHVRLKCP